MTEKHCSECRYLDSRGRSNSYAQCRRFPPISGRYGYFAEVRSPYTDWCGEWAPLEDRLEVGPGEYITDKPIFLEPGAEVKATEPLVFYNATTDTARRFICTDTAGNQRELTPGAMLRYVYGQDGLIDTLTVRSLDEYRVFANSALLGDVALSWSKFRNQANGAWFVGDWWVLEWAPGAPEEFKTDG